MSELMDEEYKKRLDLKLWRRILSHARPYSRPLLGLAVCGLVVAVLDVLLPRVTGLVIDEAITRGAGPALLRHSLHYLGLVSLMAILIWIFIVLAGKAATGFAFDLRQAAFVHLQKLSFSYYDRRPVGWLMARLTSDCAKLAGILPWFLLDLVWGTALLLGVSIMMLAMNSGLALLVMGIVPPLVAVSLFFQRRLLHAQRAVRKANSEITASFNEAIMGVRTTKTLVREEESLSEFQELSTNMYNQSVRSALQAAAFLPIVLTLGSVGVGLALWRGGLQVGGGMTLGTLVAFMQYAAFFYIPIQELAARFTQVQSAQASAERLQTLLDTEPEIRDSAEVEASAPVPGLAVSDRAAGRIREIEFRNVSFAYKEGQSVLRDFNLKASSGESIALVGPTGGGKTTIVSLLCRFYEPTQGEIWVDGQDYRTRGLHWLQSNLGVVLQTPHLFRGTVRENIRYGRLEAGEEEIRHAARLANAEPFILAHEGGYDAEVGEGGARLSTGEKQLICLARAVLADPRIFVMDEATSSVDTETERQIQEAIGRVLEGRISFIIAHRLSTVRSAHRILVIEQGRIMEEGRHEDLLQLGGRYAQLYRNQFARQREERVLEGVAIDGT